MIIETVTAVAVIETGREILEIIHLLHVGHMSAKASYKGGTSLTHFLYQRYQQYQDQKYPARKLEREAETPYDFHDADNVTQLIQDIKNEAENYLTKLSNSVKNLQEALKYFSDINEKLKKPVHALTFNDAPKFSSDLLWFQCNFAFFKGEFNQFLLSIKSPPRQILCLADFLQGENEEGVIKRFNGQVKTMKSYIHLLQKTRQSLANQLKQDFETIHTLLPTTSSSAAHSVKKSPQNTKKHKSKAMRANLKNNKKLAGIRADIMQISKEFQQIYQETEQLPLSLENNPDWFPLLTKTEQIEAGQRIFLHAMNNNKTELSDEVKLSIAKVLLHESISKQEIKPQDIDIQAYEMADVLLEWQIKKCKELTQFLGTLKQGKLEPSPEQQDFDILLRWLKTKRKEQNPIELFTEILVSPCCFSQCSIESPLANLKRLSLAENPDKLIKTHLNSHWSAIWKKNDTLIQLPTSFKTNISEEHRKEQDCQLQESSKVSSAMQKLATALIEDLRRLKIELHKNKALYSTECKVLKKEQGKVCKAQKDQDHGAGVARIKKAETLSITSPASSLFPYLYRAKTSKVEDKKRKVPTVPTLDDLSHVIYIGVDPNGICNWKGNAKTSPQSKQLAYYFYPKQANDSKMKAWIYAYATCQIDMVPLLSHLFSSPLALKNMRKSQVAIKNALSIQGMFEDSKKISSIANSKALIGVTPKTVKQTEHFFQQLQHYYVSALVRMKPEHYYQLPLWKQVACLLQNSIKFDHKTGQAIGKDRLESVQKYIGYLSAVFSGKDIVTINMALNVLKDNYEEMYKQAEHIHGSDLYSIMKKVQEGPIVEITNQAQKTLSITQKIEAVAEERREQETTQAQEQAVQKEKESEHKEKESKCKEKDITQAKAARLEALLAESQATKRKPLARRPQFTIARSRATLFKVKAKRKLLTRPQLAASQASNAAVANATNLPGYSHGS